MQHDQAPFSAIAMLSRACINTLLTSEYDHVTSGFCQASGSQFRLMERRKSLTSSLDTAHLLYIAPCPPRVMTVAFSPDKTPTHTLLPNSTANLPISHHQSLLHRSSTLSYFHHTQVSISTTLPAANHHVSVHKPATRMQREVQYARRKMP